MKQPAGKTIRAGKPAYCTPSGSTRHGEDGWALLGLLMALGVMSIVMASAIVPNVKVAVQRDKEKEMMYRGDQMARGSRLLHAGACGNATRRSPPYGYLIELPSFEMVKLNAES